MEIIETPRLIIRRPEHRDLEALAKIYNSRACMQFLGGVKSLEEIRELFTNLVNNQDSLEKLGVWVLHHKSHDRCVGKTGLNFYKVDNTQDIALDGVLSFPYWGQGLAVELFGAMRDYCFFELELQRLVAIIDPCNKGSIKAVNSIHMEYEQEVESGNHLYSIEKQCWLDSPKSNYFKGLSWNARSE